MFFLVNAIQIPFVSLALINSIVRVTPRNIRLISTPCEVQTPLCVQ